MPKSINCVVCKKRTNKSNRRTPKGKINEVRRTELARIMGGKVTGDDHICTKCTLDMNRGKLQTSGGNVDVKSFYIGTKSHKYCAICRSRKKSMKTVSKKACAQVFLKHNVILHEKARVCPSHLSNERMIKDQHINENFHRMKMGTKKLSSGELSDYLSQCRELLLKSEST